MNNFCVTSQLDDMLMSSAMGSEGKSNQGTIFQRRDSRLSNNDKNLNLFSNRLSLKNQPFFQKSGFSKLNAKKSAIVEQANKQFSGKPDYIDQMYFQ